MPKRSLDELYDLWDHYGKVSVSNTGHLNQPFMHFRKGAECLGVLRWFEDQHPGFVLSEVMQGNRVTGAMLAADTVTTLYRIEYDAWVADPATAAVRQVVRSALAAEQDDASEGVTDDARDELKGRLGANAANLCAGESDQEAALDIVERWVSEQGFPAADLIAKEMGVENALAAIAQARASSSRPS